MEFLIPLTGALLTAAVAFLLGSRGVARPRARLLVGGLALAAGAIATGAAWAAVVIRDDTSTTGAWSWPHAQHAFVGMALATLLAASALLIPVAGQRWMRNRMALARARQAAPAGLVLMVVVGVGSVLAAVGAAFLALLFWFGAANW